MRRARDAKLLAIRALKQSAADQKLTLKSWGHVHPTDSRLALIQSVEQASKPALGALASDDRDTPRTCIKSGAFLFLR